MHLRWPDKFRPERELNELSRIAVRGSGFFLKAFERDATHLPAASSNQPTSSEKAL